MLLNVEKHMRQAGDVSGTRKVVTKILQLCFEAGAWKTLNEQIVLISKRRGLLKHVFHRLVKLVMCLYLSGIASFGGGRQCSRGDVSSRREARDYLGYDYSWLSCKADTWSLWVDCFNMRVLLLV